MLAEPLSAAAGMSAGALVSTSAAVTRAAVPTPGAALTAWLLFSVLIVVGVAALPLLARVVARALPDRSRERRSLSPVSFGDSLSVRRSPRHAVLLHRVLLSTFVTCVLALLLIPGITALRSLGVAGLQVALALVVPGLFVMLHARRRGPKR